jgi:hypothetical protein
MVFHFGNIDMRDPAGRAAQFVNKNIVQDCTQPARDSVHALQTAGAAKRALNAVLDEIVGGAGIPGKRDRITPQSRKLRDKGCGKGVGHRMYR